MQFIIQRHKFDFMALGVLFLLWVLFFGRLFTPIPEDQVSVTSGDFSGQFVTFAGYQYQRFSEGEIPLWNPYNNGGLSFIGDTQAAVFYPLRLLTIALTNLSGTGWTYNALQMEMTFHILLFSIFTYIFMRRLTSGQEGSVVASLISSVIMAYGGYSAGYPQLQLAILEAEIWLPLIMLGIHEATRKIRYRWQWIVFAGFMLGISWMAGHPQTSWFITYTAIAYLAYRMYIAHYSWKNFVVGIILLGSITFGITAVQFLPGVEYLSAATRTSIGFDAKGNGFPFQDIVQFLLPGSVSVFSPLYVGILGLLLAFIAVWRRQAHSLFWFGVFVIALLLSFGENSVFYSATYNLLPGLRFFRGQERAALLIAYSLATLAGLGVIQLASWKESQRINQQLRVILIGFIAIVGLLAGGIFVAWLGDQESYSAFVSVVFFSMLIAIVSGGLILWLITHAENRIVLMGILAIVVVFDLFSVNINAESNFDPIPAHQQISITPPPLTAQILQDESNQPFRVDGFRGLTDNYGSLYQIMDIRGISPLFLRGPAEIIFRNYVMNPLAWELFAAKYVFSEQEELEVPSENLGQGVDRDGQVYLHEISEPRPFAHLVYEVAVLDSDEFAYALLDDERYNPRTSIILDQEPAIALPDTPPANATANVTMLQPENITIRVSTPENAILSIAQPHYNGWSARIDDQPISILRAYGALSAVVVPAGDHTIQLVYNPVSFQIGAIISLVTWIGVVGLGMIWLIRQLFSKQSPAD